MLAVVWGFALLAALIHVVVFLWESVLLHRPFVHEKVFSVPAGDLPALRLWTFGLGFYNLFLGLGLIAGVVLWAMGEAVQGQTLVAFISGVLVLCGVVLFIADRFEIGCTRGSQLGGAVSQAAPPLLVLVAMAFI